VAFIAILFDRVRYESFAKTIIFLPLAISATAASVIWLFMFAYQPPGTPQTGTLNAAVTSVGVAPQPWLTLSGLSLNTILLILVTTWIWTGFCMVIISAALKGINGELLEAARVDGASGWQIFRWMTIPHLRQYMELGVVLGSIYLVQAFDAIFMITSGGPGQKTTNIPFFLYEVAFRSFDIGRASAMGVVVVILTILVATFALRTISGLFSDEGMEGRI